MVQPDIAAGSSPTIVLAIDCGSTTFKGALFHASSGCLAEHEVPVPYLDRGPSSLGPPSLLGTGAIDGLAKVEIDAEGIWQTTRSLILTLCRQAGLSPTAIDRIALTSQAQTFALLDSNDQALTPFISWIDERAGAEELRDIAHFLDPNFHAHCSFAPPLAQLQLAKVLWLRRHAPALLDRAQRVIALPSYLTLRLAGLAALDPNLAAMSGLYSLRHATWWPEALALCGLTAAQLPTLVPLGARLAARRACADLSLSEHLEIVFAGNDQTAGAYGNGCQEGDIVVTLGTALVAYRTTGAEPGPYSPSGCWGPYPGGGYYELAVLSHGCLALDWAREQLLPGQPVTAFMELARAEAARSEIGLPQPVLFYPDRMGTLAAWNTTAAWDTPEPGGDATGSARALAVLEGLGFALRRLIEVDLGLTTEIEAITAIGGGSRSDLWLQVLADILGVPVRGPSLLGPGARDARTGAARLATVNDPAFALPELPGSAAQANMVFLPDPARVRNYGERYATWRNQDGRLRT